MRMWFNKCHNWNSTNLVMIDKKQLAFAPNLEILTTVLTKYGTCKLRGYINLNDARVRSFQDIINAFWVKRKPFGCKCYCKNRIYLVKLCTNLKFLFFFVFISIRFPNVFLLFNVNVSVNEVLIRSNSIFWQPFTIF